MSDAEGASEQLTQVFKLVVGVILVGAGLRWTSHPALTSCMPWMARVRSMNCGSGPPAR